MKPKIYVDGEHGTTGLQILERLKGRTDIEQLSIPHADRHDKAVRSQLLNEADFAILCLPDDGAREAHAMVADGNTRLIDASTAHRTSADWEFGFKELDPGHEKKITSARFVSNPGCYSTGAIALLRPLRNAGVLTADALVSINAVSGYTGGGKGLIAQMEDGSHDDAISAPLFTYAHGLTHKHVPEITKHCMLENPPIFTPSVGRFAQGMVVQVPFHMAQLNASSRAEVHAALADHYAACPGNEVIVSSLEEADALPRLDAAGLADQDVMRLYVFGHDKQVNLVAHLDNLGKGASGACVQSLDLMIAG